MMLPWFPLLDSCVYWIKIVQSWSYSEVLFKALILLVNILYVRLYAHMHHCPNNTLNFNPNPTNQIRALKRTSDCSNHERPKRELFTLLLPWYCYGVATRHLSHCVCVCVLGMDLVGVVMIMVLPWCCYWLSKYSPNCVCVLWVGLVGILTH